ncbi:MAG: class I SAM-dependent methyltransferase [Proteobacteria bacterium]|nr:class I SAM-dependent methyltransferase [Pseudomonadota bacterium]
MGSGLLVHRGCGSNGSNDSHGLTIVTTCRICGDAIAAFMSFGEMPIANGFLDPGSVGNEYFFELAPAFCAHCGMVQLVEQPAPERMFHDNYAFHSGTSQTMRRHFATFARSVIDGPLRGRTDPFVVELGSNDGIMLRHFKARGIRHLGVEPSDNVAALARGLGIDTIGAFFNRALADRIVAERGRADVVLAANVMCHIADLPEAAAGIARLLKSDGVLIVEDPYLGATIDKTSYDQIYDEHVFLFSVTSIAKAFAPHGLALADVQEQPTHGGSMRYVLVPAGSRPVAPSVESWRAREAVQGLGRPDTYERFRQNCERSRAALMQLLDDLHARGQRVVGYGATSKSTTVTNYCGITPKHIAFIADTTPIKQGKLSPGAHIPVRPAEEFSRPYPDCALLFAWNHETEIRAKERAFTAAGGRFITYVPEVRVAS